jgi:hypothetical protein
MENVMEMVQGPLMGELFSKISGFFRESPDAVKRGFESAVPLSMAGLAERASTQEGAQDLLSTFKGGQYPHLDQSELGRVVADPDTAAGVARSSEGFLSRLFGNKQRRVVDGLASSAGVSPSSASTLLGLALPMVLGFVGKQAVSRNMDPSGLRGFLTSQRRQMGDVLPGSLSHLVGGGAEPHAGVSGRHPVAYADAIPRYKPRIGPWVLLALAIAATLLFLMARRGAHREPRRVPSTPQTQEFTRLSKPLALQAGNMGALSQTTVAAARCSFGGPTA